MTRFVSCVIAACIIIVTAVSGSFAGVASFQGLGDLSDGIMRSQAFGISADGKVVVGYGTGSNGQEAFRWTAVDGMVGLGSMPGIPGNFTSWGMATSADGSVVVGIGIAGGLRYAIRWTEDYGMIGSGNLTGSGYRLAYGISADGSTVVGGTYGEALLWTQEGGMLNLGHLAGGVDACAFGVSSDGSVVVGQSLAPSPPEAGSTNQAFRWTADDGMVALGDLPGGVFSSSAYATSADGSVVVGGSNSAFGYEAFRWTADGGMVGLGELPGGIFNSHAKATSADGSIIVGLSNSGSGHDAFIWTADEGMRSLYEVLSIDFGLDLAGWQLADAAGISADGRTIVGVGINPDGHQEAFIAKIPLVGDLDGDGFVGITDLNIVLTAWNQNVPPGDPLADPSGDSFVGIEDLNIVLGNWNAGIPPQVPVPEPSSILLIATLGCLKLLHRKDG